MDLCEICKGINHDCAQFEFGGVWHFGCRHCEQQMWKAEVARLQKYEKTMEWIFDGEEFASLKMEMVEERG